MTDRIKTVTMSPAQQMREAAAQVRFTYVDEDGEPYTRGLTFYQQNCIRALPLPPDPRDEVIARLVEAVEAIADYGTILTSNKNHDELRAAIAAAKAVQP